MKDCLKTAQIYKEWPHEYSLQIQKKIQKNFKIKLIRWMFQKYRSEY